jgi:hypothetical protein
MIVDNLPNLRKGLTLVIDSSLMKSLPEFTYDSCQATLDKYMGDTSNTNPSLSLMESGFKFYPMKTVNLS